MDKPRTKVLGLLVILVWLTGCATMGDVVRAKDEGTAKVYPVNPDQAWEIAKTVFRQEGAADSIEEHRSEGYMLTSSGPNWVSYGAVMGAWIGPVDKNNTRVTVVTKRRIATNLATTLTETTFHKRFAEAVNTMKSEKPLSSIPSEIRSSTDKGDLPTRPQLVSPEKPLKPSPVTPSSSTNIVTVTWTFANIRSGAGDDYPVVTAVKQGHKLTIIGELGEWFNVRLENGQEGWISNKVVK